MNLNAFINDISTQDSGEIPGALANTPFIEAIWPWITVARKRLNPLVTQRGLALLEPQAYFSLEAFLIERWSEAVTHSFFTELKLHGLMQTLQGETSRDRYLYFVQQYLNKEALSSFFQESPTLFHKLIILLNFWVQRVDEFLARLETDLSVLEMQLNHGKSLGKVLDLKVGAGDVHLDGGSVHLLTFQSIQLLYKPKDLGIVQAFNLFLDNLNHLGLEPKLNSYQVIPRGEYGWEVFIAQKSCARLPEVELYYKRAGMLLCLLFLLDGKDAHFENVIAAGDSPYLIDLETLFHPMNPENEPTVVNEIFYYSVLTTGLLPAFTLNDPPQKGWDASGLGIEEHDKEKRIWSKVNTDEMHLVREMVKNHNILSVVYFMDKAVSANDFVEQQVSGFRNMYAFIKTNNVTVQQWLNSFIKYPVRYIHRSTRFYALLLKRLYSPELMFNQEQQEKVLGVLAYNNNNANKPEIMEKEKKALLQGDIPCFHVYINSRDLYVGKQKVLSHFFKQSLMAIITKRLATLSDSKCSQQESFIRQAYNAKNKEFNFHDAIEPDFVLDNHQVSELTLFSAVLSIADRIQESAFISPDGSLNWLCLHPEPATGHYELSPLDDSFYSGKSGVGLFFAALAAVTKDKKWERTAWHTIEQVLNNVTKNKSILSNQARGMSGGGGIFYTLFHIGILLNNKELQMQAIDLAEKITKEEIFKYKDTGIMTGNAGLLLAFLSLYQHSKREKLLYLAELCGEHLCTVAKKDLSLCDLSFQTGMAGIDYALERLHEVTAANTVLQLPKSIPKPRGIEKTTNNTVNNLLLSVKNAPCQWEDVSFMHGLSGVGYALLKIIDKNKQLPQDTFLII